MFKKKKRQVVKSESYDNSLLFIRVSDMITDADAIIEVPVTHNAFIIKGGGDMRFYKSGTYQAFDNKDEIKKWKQGLSVEVIYMPIDTNVVINWGGGGILYRDSVCGKVVSVGAHGKARISISNHTQFFKKVVGALRQFSIDTFENEFRTDIVNQFTDVFLQIVTEQKITYDQFAAKKLFIAEKIGNILSDKFDQSWGISFVDFIIKDFEISDEDKAKVEHDAEELRREQEEAKREAKLKKAMDELERLADKQWEREKYLKQLEQEDNFAYYEVLKVIGSKEHIEKNKGANFCPKCGHSCESTADFCPNCGARLGKTTIVCPDCKVVNNSDATYCSGCGKKIR